jgi:15-cis-phytoene desaturase
MNDDAIVVGSGVAGLRCALALADAGLRVTVLEATAHAGGRAASWIDETMGQQVDIGPHVVSSEHRNFLSMLTRLGTVDQIQWQRSPLVTLVDGEGALHMPKTFGPVPLHGLALLPRALRRLSWRDRLSHLRLAWRAARVNEEQLRDLDLENALDWLRAAGVRPRAIDWFWRSVTLALLNVPLEHCSAAALMRVYRLMLGRSGWHFGFPKLALAQLYVPGSCRAVLRSGGQVLFGARVQRLLLQDRQLAGLQTTDGNQFAASRCVLAIPPQELAALIAASDAPMLQSLANVARCFRPSGYQSTYIWYDRPVTSERFWARTWSLQGLNTDFYNLSAIRPGPAGRPSLIACNAIGPQVRADWPDHRIVEETVREIAEFAPMARQARVLHARVHRTPMGIPQPRPGIEVMRPPVTTALPGLWIAGDWTDTRLPCSMESAARSGALAAEAVLARDGRVVKLAVDAPETKGLVGLFRSR